MKQTSFILVFLIFGFGGSCKSQATKTFNGNASPKVISDPTNQLTGEIESLELQYVVWGCACPNWITPKEYLKYENNGLAERCIFIEPADAALELPLYFDPVRHRIQVTGQFYAKEDYPKGTVESEEKLAKAKVFRYTSLKVVDSRTYSPKDDVVLRLSYNAVSCICAQWSESGKDENADKKEYMYLEPADKTLQKPDALFTGENLPLEIEVTGQFVSEVGYPKDFNSSKGNAEPARVFRYSKFKIIKNG